MPPYFSNILSFICTYIATPTTYYLPKPPTSKIQMEKLTIHYCYVKTSQDLSEGKLKELNTKNIKNTAILRATSITTYHHFLVCYRLEVNKESLEHCQPPFQNKILSPTYNIGNKKTSMDIKYKIL